METALATPQTFEERIKDRIREDLGKLLTDAELSALIHKGVEDIFFKRPVIQKQYGFGSTEGPSLMEGIVKELLAEKVRDAVQEWISKHEAEVNMTIDRVLQAGAGAAVLRALGERYDGHLADMCRQIVQSGQ